MSKPFSFRLTATDGAARTGEIATAHGAVRTPAFMPVGTQAAAEDGTLAAYCGETALFITPGYRFRAVDAMLTNFHLPRSTLFMLVSAFCGLDVMRRAYAHAIDSGYRFYSYGDACLLFRAN
jgi:S-adenosylmethionine:tRNA-ribosyltransferase-isomerase (queuine synthetase)